MDQQQINKLGFLLLAILPTTLYLLFGNPDPQPGDELFQLYAFSLIGVTFYYFLMARKNVAINQNRFRILILASILFLSPFSLVFYWYRYIWKE
jgi:hypothetical protein